MFTRTDVERLLTSPGANKLFPATGRAAMVDPATILKSLEYLYWFGYIGYQAAKHISVSDVKKAVQNFKTWFGINGEAGLGNQTRLAMNYDRCGCPDITHKDCPEHAGYLRLKAFATAQRARWKKTGLKYCIDKHAYCRQLPKTTLEAIVAGAWQEWCKVCRISVERSKTCQGADLVVSGGRGAASDFDGPEGTLAWAYLPEGDDKQLLMRFDLDESWVIHRKDRGILMFNVACHEFGHMLGLDHSRVTRALMAPFYNESVGTPQPEDDIRRIQKLYGAPQTPMSATAAADRLPLRVSDLEIEGYRIVPTKGNS